MHQIFCCWWSPEGQTLLSHWTRHTAAPRLTGEELCQKKKKKNSAKMTEVQKNGEEEVIKDEQCFVNRTKKGSRGITE